MNVAIYVENVVMARRGVKRIEVAKRRSVAEKKSNRKESGS